MATQLRAIQTYSPTVEEITKGLEDHQLALSALLPEAEEISFSFGARGLMIEIKCKLREQRDAILLKLRSDLFKTIAFDKIIEGVETGARRRLTITAEVR